MDTVESHERSQRRSAGPLGNRAVAQVLHDLGIAADRHLCLVELPMEDGLTTDTNGPCNILLVLLPIHPNRSNVIAERR